MTAGRLLELAAAAERERLIRVRQYPAMIEANEIGREEARSDVHAWAAIRDWLSTGQIAIAGKGPTWRPYAAITAAALARRDEACRANPHDPRLAERRQGVAEIHAMFARNVAAFEAAA